MRKGSLEPMGGKGQTVEVDETFYGKLKDVPQNKGFAHKNVVMGLVNRDTGEVRTFHIANTSMAETMPIVLKNIHKESTIYTDEASHYRSLGQHFAKHDSVVHSREEYARGPVSTNQIEGYFSIFKRGMRGIYQHCAEHHLHRYLAEFDFRYSHRIKLGFNDRDRADAAIRGAKGKRLTYRQPT